MYYFKASSLLAMHYLSFSLNVHILSTWYIKSRHNSPLQLSCKWFVRSRNISPLACRHSHSPVNPPPPPPPLSVPVAPPQPYPSPTLTITTLPSLEPGGCFRLIPDYSDEFPLLARFIFGIAPCVGPGIIRSCAGGSPSDLSPTISR